MGLQLLRATNKELSTATSSPQRRCRSPSDSLNRVRDLSAKRRGWRFRNQVLELEECELRVCTYFDSSAIRSPVTFASSSLFDPSTMIVSRQRQISEGDGNEAQFRDVDCLDRPFLLSQLRRQSRCTRRPKIKNTPRRSKINRTYKSS